ncbi:MAG: hypothetical protein P8I55_13600 [Crocinitomix sp.]|nr:hypothetical protein [Crocinitomix sp.]
MSINNHELIWSNVEHTKSENIGGKFKEGNLLYIIIHYTAGASRKSSVRALTKKETRTMYLLIW